MEDFQILSGGLKKTSRSPKSTLREFGESAVGAPFRLASMAIGAPRALAEDLVSLRNLTSEPTETQGALDRFILNLLPSSRGFTESVLKPTVGRVLPEGSLESTGDIEKMADKIAFLAATLPLGAGKGAAQAIPYAYRALKSLPLATATTGVGKIAEEMKLPSGVQTAAELGTLAFAPWAGGKLAETGKRLFRAAPEVAGKYGTNLLKKNIPMGREFTSALSQEEMNELAMARQEELSGARMERETQRAKTKEHEQMTKALERHNRESIEEVTRGDVERLKEQTRLSKAVDRYSLENTDILSRQDAARLRKRIENGEVIEIPEGIKTAEIETAQSLSGSEQRIKELGTSEAAIIEKAGGKPGVLSERAKNLFQDFYDSIPETAPQTSAKKLEQINRWLETEMGKGINAPSKQFMGDLITKIKGKISGGKVNIKDVTAMRADINELIRTQYRTAGGLERFEKYTKSYIKFIDETLEQAAVENPKLKLDAFKEGNRISKDLAEAGKIVTYVDDLVKSKMASGKLSVVAKILNDPMKYAAQFRRSKELQRYWVRTLTSASKKKAAETINNAIKLNNVLGEAKTTESEGTPIFGAPSGFEILKGGLKRKPA